MIIYKLNTITKVVNKLNMKYNIYNCNISDNIKYTFYIINNTRKHITIAYTKDNKIVLTDIGKQLNINVLNNKFLYIKSNKLQLTKQKKISIIMAYYNRKEQLLETLKQFEKLYAGKYKFEVIIADDCSSDEHIVSSYISNFTFKIKYIQLYNKTWINPCIPTNIAINNISDDTDYVIIQNPEIFHCGDIISVILSDISDELDNTYYTFPVFASPSFKHNKDLYKIDDKYYENFVQNINYDNYKFDYEYYITKYPDINNLSKKEAFKNFIDIGLKENRQCNKYNIFYPINVIKYWKGWYNHPRYNNRNLHFLSCISYNNLKKIGGFCNELKDGIGYDDDEFLYRIKKILKVKCFNSNSCIGIHQYHDNGTFSLSQFKLKELISINKIIYNNLKKNIIYKNPYLNIKYKSISNI